MAAFSDALDSPDPIVRALRDSGRRLRAAPEAAPTPDFVRRGRLAVLEATRAPRPSRFWTPREWRAGMAWPRAVAAVGVALALLAAVAARPPAFAAALDHAASGVEELVHSGAQLLPVWAQEPTTRPPAAARTVVPTAANGAVTSMATTATVASSATASDTLTHSSSAAAMSDARGTASAMAASEATTATTASSTAPRQTSTPSTAPTRGAPGQEHKTDPTSTRGGQSRAADNGDSDRAGEGRERATDQDHAAPVSAQRSAASPGQQRRADATPSGDAPAASSVGAGHGNSSPVNSGAASSGPGNGGSARGGGSGNGGGDNGGGSAGRGGGSGGGGHGDATHGHGNGR